VLSLAELRRAVEALGAGRAGARIERVVQPDAATVVLELAGGGEHPARDRLALVLSCAPGAARLGARPRPPRAAATTPPFGQYLRAHLEGGRLRAAALRAEDRQAALAVETREGRFELLLSILGPRSNLYLLDADDRLVMAARPLAETRAELAPGEPWREPAGRPPGEGDDRFAGAEGDALLAAVERHYAALAEERDEDRLRRRIARALGKARSAVAKKIGRLEADAAAGDDAPGLERQGELLKASLSRVRPGDRAVTARDFASGEPVEIPLDPTKSAAANLESLFKRARKATRRAAQAAVERGGLRAREEELAALESELEAASDAAALEALAARPELERLLARYAPEAAAPGPAGAPAPKKKTWKLGKRELPTRLVPKRYRTSDSLEVWVGKSDEGNDLLTTRLARGNDLFFHLEGSPGSHVVLRTQGAGEPPQASLLEAAELAVHFSKQRSATRASVHVAAIKDVSKPPGTKPGLVYVHRGRTVGLRRSPERLRRILEARLDD